MEVERMQDPDVLRARATFTGTERHTPEAEPGGTVRRSQLARDRPPAVRYGPEDRLKIRLPAARLRPRPPAGQQEPDAHCGIDHDALVEHTLEDVNRLCSTDALNRHGSPP